MDPSGFYQALGRRIKEAREKAGLTQESLATRLSLTRTSVTNIEKGRQKLLLHTFCDIVRTLGVTVPTLLPEHSDHEDVALDEMLKGRPAKEQEWIKTTMNSSKKDH